VNGKAADVYAGESVVLVRVADVFAMNADGTGYHEHTVVARIQSDAAVRQLGVIAVPFASASEKVEFVYARVRRADGTVAETPGADALEQPEAVTQQAPFYSDLKQKQLPIKSLRVGDTLEWKAKITTFKAEAPGQFWGAESVIEDGVVLDQSYELRVPKGMAVTVWTNPKLGVKPVESALAGSPEQKVYVWKYASLKPTTGKEADAEKEAKKKRLLTEDEELDNREGKLPSLGWTTFKSWEEVGGWYRKLEGDRMVPDDEVKAKVGELTAGKTTEEEKVRAVYGYVASQIRYIGVAFGVGRYQPHHADEVMENQYGDCKDKHTLLASMLTALGLHPDAVLIGAGVRFNEALPSPGAFNHLITRVEVGGQEVWLDATAEVAPYRALQYVIRDKQALVIPETGAAQVLKTPKDLPFASTQEWVAKGVLDKEGTSESHIAITLRGDSEIAIRQVLRQVAPAQYDQLAQNMSNGMGYAGTTSHPEFGRPDDTKEPLEIGYDYKREKNGDWATYRIIPQLAPVSLPTVNEAEPPVGSIELGVPRTEVSHAEMKLPEGWGVELPEAVHEKTAFATYDLTYRFDKGTLYAERKVEVLEERVAAKDWKTYKAWQDAVGLGNETYVQLTRSKGDAAADAGKASGPPTVSSAKAEKLVQEALTALNQHDLATASPKLDEAKALNPQQVSLWGAMGYLAMLRGETTEAVRDYQKEIALHPEAYWVYGPIVQTQIVMGKRADAEGSLKSWAAADAGNPAPTARLAAMLEEDGNAAGAVEVVQAGIARMPEEKKKDESLLFALGSAEMKAGMEGKGAAVLAELLKTTTNLWMMNSAAYLLADENKELPQAESTERSLLDKLAVESGAWTLDEAPATLAAKSSLLVASWDTMGWILFREGKRDEAMEYVSAAWLNAQHGEVGEHVGEIKLAAGDATGAVGAYELALAAEPKYDMLGVRKPESAEEKAIKGKLERAKKAGGKPVIKDGEKSLQEMRTVALGAANGKDGVAEYRLLLAHGTVERAEPTGEKTIAGGVELIETAKVPQLFPKDSKAKLVRTAMLNCHAGACELVFEGTGAGGS